MTRINVVGISGSGKSTFARKLAQRLGSPYVEMDMLFWKSNWTPTVDPEFFAKLDAALSGNRWVLDGNYDRTMPIKWKRVTTVIWVDYSTPRIIWQSVSRAFRRAVTQEELWPGTGNRESIRRSLFSKDSILLWMLQSLTRMRKRYTARMKDPAFAHIQFIRLRSPREAREFLEAVNTRK